MEVRSCLPNVFFPDLFYPPKSATDVNVTWQCFPVSDRKEEGDGRGPVGGGRGGNGGEEKEVCHF